ncbi:hypothetical protein RF11_15546 [Thelohanellus kitauei]|uniref:Uncharacterized protein n=1 Tax=Thelohanellus kitauei TaxID=669202 RepID=A0A0C2IIU4_THEKT|nr:hypothetical protein RF11_15546 [Thelohanellus kitauei]
MSTVPENSIRHNSALYMLQNVEVRPPSIRWSAIQATAVCFRNFKTGSTIHPSKSFPSRKSSISYFIGYPDCVSPGSCVGGESLYRVQWVRELQFHIIIFHRIPLQVALNHLSKDLLLSKEIKSSFNGVNESFSMTSLLNYPCNGAELIMLFIDAPTGALPAPATSETLENNCAYYISNTVLWIAGS